MKRGIRRTTSKIHSTLGSKMNVAGQGKLKNMDMGILENSGVETSGKWENIQRVKKKSNIWNFYVEDYDETKAKCIVCEENISRGGTGRNASTTSMINHLKRKHPEHFSLYSETASVKKQVTITEVITKEKHRRHENPKAVDLNYKVAEMLAVDNMPVHVVEKDGFQRLIKALQPSYQVPSVTILSNEIIPDIFKRCKVKVFSLISEAKYLSFTTDIWMSATNESFISLAAHWVSNDFEFKHVILDTSHLPGYYIGDAIDEKLTALLIEWRICPQKLHLFVRDNAVKIETGLTTAQIPNETCFIHTLHLAVQDSIKSQASVADMIAAARNIVSHFNHTELSCTRLKEIQVQMSLEEKELVLDVPTRWNSTYYMLDRLLQLKDCLSLIADEVSITNLEEQEWSLLKATLSLLQPLEEVTKILSESKSSLADVIPLTATLKRYLEKENHLHEEISTFKAALKASILTRTAHVFTSPNHMKATFLDPRYKLDFLPEHSREILKMSLIQELINAVNVNKSVVNKNVTTKEGGECSSTSGASQLHEEKHSEFWTCFSEIQTEQRCEIEEGETPTQEQSVIINEINLYASFPTLSKKECPLLWWKKNRGIYPFTTSLVFKYLSAPASTVFREKLYSTEGNLYEDNRNQFLPVHGEMLAFLNCNLKLLDYKY